MSLVCRLEFRAGLLVRGDVKKNFSESAREIAIKFGDLDAKSFPSILLLPQLVPFLTSSPNEAVHATLLSNDRRFPIHCSHSRRICFALCYKRAEKSSALPVPQRRLLPCPSRECSHSCETKHMRYRQDADSLLSTSLIRHQSLVSRPASPHTGNIQLSSEHCGVALMTTSFHLQSSILSI